MLHLGVRALALGLALLSAPLRATEYVELVDLQLIDGSGAPLRHVDSLIARDGVIVRIDAAGKVPEPEADARWTRIGLNGAWVIPGKEPLVRLDLPLSPGLAEARLIGFVHGLTGASIRAEAAWAPGEEPTLLVEASERVQPANPGF